MKKIKFYYKIGSYKEVVVNFYKTKPFDFFLITCIFTLTIFKLNLIGSGYLSLIDESRYLLSGKVLEHIKVLDFNSAIKDVFSAHGRPGDTLIKIIPNAFQFLTATIFKTNIYDSNNSYPLFIFNYIIYILILIVHFKFSKLILKNTTLALIAVLLFSSLTNSYIYLRHALPYDLSLFLFYFIIYKIVKIRDVNLKLFKNYFLLGIVSFFSYLIYPGYVPLLLLIGFFIFFYNLKFNFKRNFTNSAFFIFGNILCLLLIETLAKFGGTSYIGEALKLSGTITQGSFQESFSFLFKYLFLVEKGNGIIIIFSLLIFLFMILKKYRFREKDFKIQPLFLLSFILIGLFITYAGLGYFFNKVVFYGRLIHQYIPFICIVTVFSINIIFKNYSRRILILSIFSIFLIVNFLFNFYEYKSFAYPRDMICKLRNLNLLDKVNYVCEYDNNLSLEPQNKIIFNDNLKVNKYLTLLNGAYMLNVRDLVGEYHKFENYKKYHLIFSKTHFLTFKGYQFEGCTIQERNNFDEIKFKLELYSKYNHY